MIRREIVKHARLTHALKRVRSDEAFYQRFEDVPGRYPKVDLERGFFQVVLEKATGRRR